MNKPVISNITQGIRIKHPTIKINSETIKIGDVFLDIPIKITLEGIQNKVTIILETDIYFNGLSLRKLDLKKIRNPIKKRNFKASNKKDNGNLINKIDRKFLEGLFGVIGYRYILSFIDGFLNLLLQKRKYDGKNTFQGKLKIEEKEIGRNNFEVKKYNNSKYISTKSIITFQKKQKGLLTHRLNIPIEGLSRDHAKELSFSIKTKIQILVDDFLIETITLNKQELITGGIGFKTLVSSNNLSTNLQ